MPTRRGRGAHRGRRSGPPERRRPQLRRRPRPSAARSTTTPCWPTCASAARSRPSCASSWRREAFATVAAYNAGGGRLPQPDQRHPLPVAPDARAGEAGRPALRREPPPARRDLPRDEPSRRRDRGRGPPPGRAADLQRPAGPGCRPSHRLRLHRPDGVIVKRANPVGLATSDSLASAYQRALECDPVNAFGAILAGQPRRRRGDGPGHRGHAVRGGRGARLRRGPRCAILRGKSDMPLLQVPGTPASGRPDYGMADLDFVGSMAGCWWRRSTAIEVDHSLLRGGDPAAAHAGGADRSAVRLALRPPRHGATRSCWPATPPSSGSAPDRQPAGGRRDRPAPGGRNGPS